MCPQNYNPQILNDVINRVILRYVKEKVEQWENLTCLKMCWEAEKIVSDFICVK